MLFAAKMRKKPKAEILLRLLRFFAAMTGAHPTLVVHWLLVVRCWMLGVGCWVLNVFRGVI